MGLDKDLLEGGLGCRFTVTRSSDWLAVNPANAILDYLYALLEAETRIACLTVGLNPSLGILHAARPDSVKPTLGYVPERLQS